MLAIQLAHSLVVPRWRSRKDLFIRLRDVGLELCTDMVP